MSLRHLAREIALQALFNWDFQERTEQTPDEIIGFSLSLREKVYDTEFPTQLFEGVIKKVQVIDDIIEKAAPAWPIDRIALVDRNILRLGIFEMLFSERKDVPPRVAINESIELAKSFGGPNSYKFVSGVLGSVYEASNLKEKEDEWEAEQKDPNKFRIEKKSGVLIYSQNQKNELVFAALHDVFNKWTIPKMTITASHDIHETARLAAEHDFGIYDLEIVSEIGVNEYISSDPVYGKMKKQVHYVLAKTSRVELQQDPDDTKITEVAWLTREEFLGKDTYTDITSLLIKGMDQAQKGF